MLHQNAKQRLWSLVPETYEIEWFDPRVDSRVSDTITLDPSRQIRWARQGSAIEYPCVYLNITPEGEPRGDMDHFFEDGIYKEPHPDDTVAYTKFIAVPMYATLTVTVAVRESTSTIPKNVIADEIARQVWHEFRFESGHLDQMGVTPDGETLEYAWPMSLNDTSDGVIDTSGIVDEQPIERRQFDMRIDYAYFNEEEIPSLAAAEVVFGLDIDYDGESEIETDPMWVGETPVQSMPYTAEAEADAHPPTIHTEQN